MSSLIVIVGAGGHGNVLAEIISLSGKYEFAGFTDIDGQENMGRKNGFQHILGTDDILPGLLSKGIEFAAIGVGSVGYNGNRKKIFGKILHIGFRLPVLIHPGAVVSGSARLGRATAVMANATVNTNAEIGENVIVNSGAIVEHDCRVEDHVHVASGACLASGVRVGRESHIGAGSAVIQGVSIGRNSLIGAGASVVSDIPDNTVALGVPARVIRRNP